jgi:hypothetical protein
MSTTEENGRADRPVVRPWRGGEAVIHPTIHRELAREREADFRRAADNARRAAQVRRETPLLATFTPAVAAIEALRLFALRRPRPA